MTADWTRHVVVCGLDGVGLRTVEQLHLAGVAVVAVDPAPDVRRAQAVAGWGVPLLTGSPRLPQTLHDAGLWGAQAVLCVAGDDLAALETALLVRELRPEVRTAVRLSNPAVAEAVAALGIAVLDVARLSAPAVVEACLRRRSHDVEIAGRSFAAVRTTASRAGTLRDLYGDLAPLAAGAPGAVPLLCPGRDVRVEPGDEVTVLGSHRELVTAGLRAPDETPGRRPTGRRYAQGPAAPAGPALPRREPVRRRVRGAVGAVASVADRPVRIVLSLLLLLVVVSTVVLRLSYREPVGGGGMSVADAVYFTVETISTVGYGDFSFARQELPLEVFGIGLIVVGAGLITATFALLTNALVSRRVEVALGRSTAQSMRDHIVLVGLGAVGLRVLESLVAAGRQVVVVESDEDNRHLLQARALKVPVVRGDATQAETLAAAQVGRAAAVAALTSDDLANIEAGLAIRSALGDRWSTVPVALRIFDRQLARTVEHSLGFRHVRSTSALAAPFFVGAALGLEVLGTFEVADSTMLLGRLAVADGGGLDGLAMSELSSRSRVVALERAGGGLEHPPRRGTRFAAGDRAYVIGPYDEVLAVLRRDQVAPDAAVEVDR